VDFIDIVYIVLIFVCLVLSAFFSGSETAFISIQRVRLEHMLSTNVPGAKRIAKILKRPERFLSTILLGNNLVNVAIASLATVLCVKFIPEQSLLVSTVGVTIMVLILGETTPKTIANKHSERLATWLAPTIQTISLIMTPFVYVISWISTQFNKLFGGKSEKPSLISDEEIRTMITIGSRDGTVGRAEAEMLHNVFDFGDNPVREVMVPRLEVAAIEQGSTITQFLELYTRSPMSRFPVYKENMDNIVGILSVKDALMSMAKGTITNESTIDNLIRPAYFAPETKHISDLFTEMRDKNYRMAVVVDEYGGTAGIVSLSRLVEEIVGHLGDELAVAQKDYEIINEYTFQIDGAMRIEEINQEVGLDLPEGDYETVAGFVLHLLGHIPREGEQLKYKNLKLVVTAMQGLKIEKILITREKHAEITR
jgi:putative hemolysin